MKKQQVLYIHGGESFEKHEDFLQRLQMADLWHMSGKDYLAGSKKWTTTLAEDLGAGYEVIMPPMPNKQNAKYQEWKIWFERHFEHLHDGVILIGCSLGAMFLTKYFIENKAPFVVKMLVIMACPIQTGDFTDTSCGDFLSDVADLPKLSKKAAHTFILHSKDDFVVPYEHALHYKAALPEAELITFEDKNHFLVSELPELLDILKKY
jgi:predicted alpha/beta hydrolase family esterase